MKDQIHCVSEKRLYPVFDQSGFVTPDPNAIAEEALAAAQSQGKNQGPAPTSFDYEFSIDHALAQSVAVAGEFNGWKPTINLQKVGGACWKAKANLPVPADGSRLQYKFVINGTEWVMNENAPKASDPRGRVNNAVPVPGRSTAPPMASSGSVQGPPEQKTFEDIRYARMCLNRVHTDCTRRDAEIYMHKQAEDVLVVTRALEADLFSDFDSYVSITRFCFYNKGGDYNYSTSIELPGFMSEVVFAGYLEIPDAVYNDSRLGDKQHLYGPRGCKLQSFNYLDGKFCHRERMNDHQERLNFFFMPPSFTCVLKVKSRTFVKEAVQLLNGIHSDPRLDKVFTGSPQSALNHVLFRCEHEEKDLSNGTRGTFGLKSTGAFPYAGLTSIIHLLHGLKLSKDMGAELFDNIRSGDWLIDYTVGRIRDY